MCRMGEEPSSESSASPKNNKSPSVAAYLGLALIWLYRHNLSLFMGRSCRYAPTCSQYTEEAIRAYGLWAGGWIGLARILRCNPWGASGFDPVPEELPEGSNWYRPWRYGRWSGRHMDKTMRLD